MLIPFKLNSHYIIKVLGHNYLLVLTFDSRKINIP